MTYTEFIKEIENNIAKANCNKLNIGEYEEKQKQIYKQIRTDAIDKLSSIVLKELREIAKDEDYYFDNDNLILVSSVILTNAEKLKEQNEQRNNNE